MITRITRTTIAVASAVAAAATATIITSAATPKFYKDDPVWVERDTQDASTMKPLEVSLFVDLAYNILTGSVDRDPGRARNVNTVDEVPDSSWYTNRLGVQPLTPDDVATGPNTSDGPADGVWTITSSKSDGVTPGFTIKDATGQRWFLKFDPPGYRGMTTGTEVTVTKLMWALGYNVPENHIAHLRREQLVLGDGAKFTPPGRTPRTMRNDDVDRLLERAERDTDGSYRVVASRALEGTPIGRIRFRDTRSDDPNDIVAHEDRRELRGYGVFAAWVNHVDAKAINSLDTLVTENGRSFVRHHLIDFGSALGSGGVAPSDYWEGSEYLVQGREVGKRMLGFGFSMPEWRTKAVYESPAVGRFPLHNTAFNPDLWRPRVPNQAFLHARIDDKFWAARKLTALTVDMIRAAVKAGEFGNPADEEFLVRALVERRDAIERAYLPAINPLVNPTLDEQGTLTFTNAAVEADVARAPHGYRAEWFLFDNATGGTDCLGTTSGSTTRLTVPVDLPNTEGAYIKVDVNAAGGPASWSDPVSFYFQRHAGGWRLVGLERMANSAE